MRKCTCGNNMITSIDSDSGGKYYMYHCPHCMELEFADYEKTVRMVKERMAREKVIFT